MLKIIEKLSVSYLLFPLATLAEVGKKIFSKTFNKLLEWLESVTSFTKSLTLLGTTKSLCLLVNLLLHFLYYEKNKAGITVFFVLVSTAVLIWSVVWMVLLLYYSNTTATKYLQIYFRPFASSRLVSGWACLCLILWPLSVAHLIISKGPFTNYVIGKVGFKINSDE